MTHPKRTALLAVATLLAAVPACQSSTDAPVDPGSDVFEGIHAGQVLGLAGRPFAVRVSSAGVVLVTQQDNAAVARFEVGDESVTLDPLPVGTDPGDVIVTSDGSEAIISTFVDGDLHFVDMATGEEDVLPIGANAYRLELSGDNGRVFVTTTYGRVYLVNRLLREKVDSITLGGSIQAIAEHPGTFHIAVASTAGNIWLLHPHTLDVIASGSIAGTIQDIAFGGEGWGKLFAASESPNWIAVLNSSSLVQYDSIGFTPEQQIAPFGLTVGHQDGRKMIVTSAATGRAALIDTHTHEIQRVFVLGGQPRRVAFDALNLHAFIANEMNWVDVIR